MTSLRLEQLSISMEEGVVTRWLVPDGTVVSKGQPVVEVETDKSTVEIEAPAAGALRIVVAEGAIVPVDSVLAEIGEAAPAGVQVSEPDPSAPAVAAAPGAARPQRPAQSASGERQFVSPAARRRARERGVDVASLAGTGPGGRVVARDIEHAPAPSATGLATDLRGLVVESITRSWQAIPHIHIAGDLVADGLAAARDGAPAGTTVTDLLVMAVAAALQDEPGLNGHVTGEGPACSANVHLALAVATGAGVVAPVLHSAHDLSLPQITAERARLVTAAREGRLEKRDLGGATCTLSNLGAYPVDFFAPVISGPQICLVATGRLVEKPVAIEGMVAVRSRLFVNAAIDHRGADGAAGGRFLAALERHLANLPDRIR